MSILDITGQFSDRRCRVRQIELFFVVVFGLQKNEKKKKKRIRCLIGKEKQTNKQTNKNIRTK